MTMAEVDALFDEVHQPNKMAQLLFVKAGATALDRMSRINRIDSSPIRTQTWHPDACFGDSSSGASCYSCPKPLPVRR